MAQTPSRIGEGCDESVTVSRFSMIIILCQKNQRRSGLISTLSS